jgi:hypothetical protein
MQKKRKNLKGLRLKELEPKCRIRKIEQKEMKAALKTKKNMRSFTTIEK